MKVKQALQKGRDAFVALIRRRDPAEYFIVLMLLSLSVFFLRCVIAGSDAFIGVFFLNGEDLFMDFLNSLRDVSHGVGVYTERHVIYPPLANAFLFLISRFIPEKYLATSGEEKFTWNEHPETSLAILFFFVLCITVLCLLIGRESISPRKRTLLTFLTIASFPFLTLMERGNVVIVCILALLVYLQNYNSESRVAREIALLMLALAAAFKLYPALFGLILLYDRRYKDALRAALYTVLLLLIPSFCFGGPICLWWVVENTLSYSGYASQNVSGFLATLHLPTWIGTAALFSGYALAVAVASLSAFLQQKPWKVWVFVCTILMSVASIFSSYNWLLILPAVLYFMRTEKLEGVNWLYFILMTAPFYYYFPKEWQGNFFVTLIVCLYLLCVGEAVLLFRSFFRAKKERKAAGAAPQD